MVRAGAGFPRPPGAGASDALVDRECLLVAGGGGPIVTGQPVQHIELVEQPGPPVAIAEVAAQRLGLVEGGGAGRDVAGQPAWVLPSGGSLAGVGDVAGNDDGAADEVDGVAV